jgi:hypothetical protein
MKLAAIFNVWSDWDWLDYSTENISHVVDGIIVVASTYSNYKEYSPIPERWKEKVIVREPHFNIPLHSETDKRNYGLEIARKAGYTHFVMMDADEFYHKDQFSKAKERFKVEPNLQGLVCPCNCYFKSPTLTIGRDVTLVPFIHKITPSLRFEFNRRYPFAWIDGQIRIDPTRSMNINSGVEYTEDVVMEHYSHVRVDYEKKIRNSTARSNLERSTIRHDLETAKEGEFCKYYGKVLSRAPNYFNIHGFLDKDLLPVSSTDQTR